MEIKRGPGRPPKAEGEVYRVTMFRCPPAIWAAVEAEVPRQKRSQFVVEAIRRELLRRHALKIEGKGSVDSE